MNINACNASNLPIDAAAVIRARNPSSDVADTSMKKHEVADSGGEAGGIAGGPEGGPGRSYCSRDLQHLMIDWGMTNSAWDVDGSGIVDIDDMLQVMNNMGDDAPDAPPEIPPPTPGTNNTLQHVMVDWGQTDSPYDLNADGIVDIDDMLMSINNWEEGSGSAGRVASESNAPPAPPSAIASVDTPPTATPVVSEPPALDAPSAVADPAAPIAAAPVPASSEIDKPLFKSGIRRISAALIERLSAAGYADHPPRNLREIIDGMNLSDQGRKSVLAHLARHYPKGLGVNLRA